MRIFVFEPFTGGGCLGGGPPSAWSRRADRILRALLRDLSDLPGAKVTTIRAAHLDPVPCAAAVHYVRHRREARAARRRCLRECDALWVLAPETRRLLERLTRQGARAGHPLLGSRACAVTVAASTTRLAAHLARNGIPAPVPIAPAAVVDWSSKWVLQPDCGSVGEGIRIVTSQTEAEAACAAPGGGRLIARPYIRGPAVSLTLLCKDGRCRVLSTDLPQVAVVNDRLLRLGQIVNGLSDQAPRYLHLAQRLAAALPGLWGIVGVDLLVTDQGAQVVAITPRPPNSYPGLRNSIGCNPAQLVTDLLDSDAALSAALDTLPVETDVPLIFDECVQDTPGDA